MLQDASIMPATKSKKQVRALGAMERCREVSVRFHAATALVEATGRCVDFSDYSAFFNFLAAADEPITFNGRTYDLIARGRSKETMAEAAPRFERLAKLLKTEKRNRAFAPKVGTDL
jgi:hypothetical protein